MAEQTYFAEWTPWGPAFLTDEQGEVGKLGVDYTDNVDTRWERQSMLGPYLNLLDCGTADASVGSPASGAGTPANTNGFAVAPTSMQANGPYLYAIRGTKWAKIKIASGTGALTLTSTGAQAPLAEAATSILYTRGDAHGSPIVYTEEISIGMRNTNFAVITAVGSGATDTVGSGGVKASIIARAASSSSYRDIALLGAGAGDKENKVMMITLSGAANMDATAAVTRATLAGEPLVFTGFALDGDKWILGTSNGPYYLDATFQEFRPLIEELDNDTNHCDQMGVWGALNSSVIIPLYRSTRVSKNLSGRSVGPGVYVENGSPLQGHTSAFTSSERWGYFAVRNAVLDKTWLCAARPTFDGDWHRYPLSFFPIVKFPDGIECASAYWVGTQGGRTLPFVALGHDDDVAWIDEGRTDRFYDDTSYQYAASGTLYLTKMKRQPDVYKDIMWFDVETAGCDSGDESITLSVVVTDRYGNESTIQVGAPISSNGIHRLRVSQDSPINMARDIKPVLAFARGTTKTNSPRLVAKIRMAYTVKPMNL